MGLIRSRVITRGVSIGAFANGFVLPVGVKLSGTSLAFYLLTTITQKSFKISPIKQKEVCN